MRNDVNEIKLGQVLTQIRRPIEVSTLESVPYAGVRWYAEGVYRREMVDAKAVKAKSLDVLHAGDITYNRMWAKKASFGIAGEDVDGCVVTNDFPIFSPSNELLPEYVGLLFQTAPFQAEAAARATGTTERARLKERDFLEIPVRLPSLAEQRRIVSLIGAVDHASEAARRAERASRIALGALLDEETANSSTSVGAEATIKSGASWSAKDASDQPTPASRKVLTIANTKPNGSVDTSTLTHVAGLSEKAATITPHSIIMIRTNGNRTRIGNVYRAPVETIGGAVSAFQFIIEPGQLADRDYLFWMLSAPKRQAQISGAVKGSTGLGNVAATWVRELQVPWPDASVRAAHAELFEAAEAERQSAFALEESLRSLRSELLTACLSGDHVIPESYDELLGA